MRLVGSALVPFSKDIIDEIESVLMFKAYHTQYIFTWDNIPAEHLSLVADSLNDTYGICLSPDEFWKLSILECCGVVQVHVMDRLDVRPRHQEVLAILTDLIDEITDIGTDAILMTRSLEEDLALDSMSIIQITIDTEKEFGIKIPDEDAKELNTIGDYVVYVVNNTADEVSVQ